MRITFNFIYIESLSSKLFRLLSLVLNVAHAYFVNISTTVKIKL